LAKGEAALVEAQGRFEVMKDKFELGRVEYENGKVAMAQTLEKEKLEIRRQELVGRKWEVRLQREQIAVDRKLDMVEVGTSAGLQRRIASHLEDERSLRFREALLDARLSHTESALQQVHFREAAIQLQAVDMGEKWEEMTRTLHEREMGLECESKGVQERMDEVIIREFMVEEQLRTASTKVQAAKILETKAQRLMAAADARAWAVMESESCVDERGEAMKEQERRLVRFEGEVREQFREVEAVMGQASKPEAKDWTKKRMIHLRRALDMEYGYQENSQQPDADDDIDITMTVHQPTYYPRFAM
jgi:hypothetical protein